MTKTFFISGTVLLLFVGLVMLLFAFKTGDIETPEYKVIKTIGEVEIRQYLKMVVAQTTLSDTAMDKNMNNGFRTIAGYFW